MAKQHITPKFSDYTKEVWSEEECKLEVSTDVDNLIKNAVGFYSLLMEWDKADE
jgi:hypothetical protein